MLEEGVSRSAGRAGSAGEPIRSSRCPGRRWRERRPAGGCKPPRPGPPSSGQQKTSRMRRSFAECAVAFSRTNEVMPRRASDYLIPWTSPPGDKDGGGEKNRQFTGQDNGRIMAQSLPTVKHAPFGNALSRPLKDGLALRPTDGRDRRVGGCHAPDAKKSPGRVCGGAAPGAWAR
jgi:hypothetical protein